MANLEDAYKFTITDGIVTAVYEYDDGIWKQKSIDSGETYTVDPGDGRVVIKTEVEEGQTKTDRFLSTDGGQTYYELDGDGSGESESEVDGDLYRFQFDASSNVIGASKFDDGIWKQVRLDPNETFQVDPVLGVQRVIKTEAERGQTKTEIYEDLDGDGNYVEVDAGDTSQDDVFVGTASVDVARGGVGSDELYGNSGDDDLYGDDGNDDLFGDDGSDDLFGGSGSDELYGASGNDRLAGEAGDDDLRGNDGNDDLNGGEGNDDLAGGAGSDKLTGGLGQDRLTGGLAADSFLFNSKAESAVGAGRDVIVDFNVSQRDLLNLAGIDANERSSGNQAFTWIGTRGFSGVAGQLRFFTVSSPVGIVVQGDVNGDRSADFEISILGINSLGTSQVVL